MLGNVIQQLFGRSDTPTMGAAVSVVMMLSVTILVCLLLLGTGYNRKRAMLK